MKTHAGAELQSVPNRILVPFALKILFSARIDDEGEKNY